MKKKGIIFDCDGCLLDSESIFLQAVKEYLHSLNVETEISELVFVIGKPMTDIAQDLIDKYHLSQTCEQFIQGERVVFNQKINDVELQPMAGLIDFIHRCKTQGIQLAIASSSPKSYVHNIVNQFGITDCFDIIVTGEEVEHGKPSPDIYLLSASKLGIPVDELIVIEDSTNGIQAGKSAGIFTVGYKGAIVAQDTSKADICIDHYDQLKFNK